MRLLVAFLYITSAAGCGRLGYQVHQRGQDEAGMDARGSSQDAAFADADRTNQLDSGLTVDVPIVDVTFTDALSFADGGADMLAGDALDAQAAIGDVSSADSSTPTIDVPVDVLTVAAPDASPDAAADVPADIPIDTGPRPMWVVPTVMTQSGSASNICTNALLYDDASEKLLATVAGNGGALDIDPSLTSTGEFDSLLVLQPGGDLDWSLRSQSTDRVSMRGLILEGTRLTLLGFAGSNVNVDNGTSPIDTLGSPCGFAFEVDVLTRTPSNLRSYAMSWGISDAARAPNGDIGFVGTVVGPMQLPALAPVSFAGGYGGLGIVQSSGAGRLQRGFATANPQGFSSTTGIRYDSVGNMYVTGAASRDVDFGGPAESPSAPFVSYGFIASYSPTGLYRWHRVLRSSTTNALMSLTLDERTTPTRVSVVGHLSGTSSISGPGLTTHNFSATRDSSPDVVWITFEDDGDLLSTNTIPSTNVQSGTLIATTAVSGEFVIAGSYSNAPFEGVGPISGSSSVFLAMIDAAGNVRETRIIDGTANVDLRDLVTSIDGSRAFLSGCSRLNVSFDGTLVPGGPESRGFIYLFNASP